MKQIPRSRTAFLEDNTLDETGGVPRTRGFVRDATSPRGILEWFTSEGFPLPPGQTWIESEQAYNFVLIAENAESVTLLLYGEADQAHPLFSLTLDHHIHKLRSIWFCKVPKKDAGPVRYYGYSISGPSPGARTFAMPLIPTRCCSIPSPGRSGFLLSLIARLRKGRGRPPVRPRWEY